jgi:hypothetical protein
LHDANGVSHDDPSANDAPTNPPDRGGSSLPRTGSLPSLARVRARWTAFSVGAASLLCGGRALADDVLVHIDSPVPAQLAEYSHHAGRVRGRIVGWSEDRPVCSSPCDRQLSLDANRRYVITGAFPESPTFPASDLTGEVTITVKPGSDRRFWAGYGVLLGGVTILSSPSVLLCVFGTDGNNVAVTGAGIGLAVVEGVAAITGAVLMATSRTRVKVRQTGVGAVARPAKVEPRYWMGEF